MQVDLEVDGVDAAVEQVAAHEQARDMSKDPIKHILGAFDSVRRSKARKLDEDHAPIARLASPAPEVPRSDERRQHS